MGETLLRLRVNSFCVIPIFITLEVNFLYLGKSKPLFLFSLKEATKYKFCEAIWPHPANTSACE